tara:strand:+ start:91 stop:711 length:621 start_codon:yes stop_codon:yes gene_type:complete
MALHYHETGLPEHMPRLRKAFECALHARDSAIDNISDPAARSRKQEEWEQFIRDQSNAAKLLLSIHDNIPAKRREVPAMASFVASTDNGFSATLTQFGIAPTLFCLRAFMWIALLKSRRADTLIKFSGQPSDRMREFTAATIITGFNRAKREFGNPNIDENEKMRQLEHYKRTYPQALTLIKANTLPEPLATQSAQLLEDIQNIHL